MVVKRSRFGMCSILPCFMVVVMAFAGCGRAAKVDVISPHRGPIQESFMEPARTRLAKKYPVTMPVAGRIARIDLEPGDEVRAGQTLVEFDRLPIERTAAEARAVVAELKARIAVQDDERVERIDVTKAQANAEAASESFKVAEAQVRAGKARLERAEKEIKRVEELAAKNDVSQSALDDARLAVETLQANLRQHESAREQAKAQLVAAGLVVFVDERLAVGREGRAPRIAWPSL